MLEICWGVFRRFPPGWDGIWLQKGEASQVEKAVSEQSKHSHVKAALDFCDLCCSRAKASAATFQTLHHLICQAEWSDCLHSFDQIFLSRTRHQLSARIADYFFKGKKLKKEKRNKCISSSLRAGGSISRKAALSERFVLLWDATEECLKQTSATHFKVTTAAQICV